MIKSLSIVIPAYNEETNIRLGALDKVVLYMEKQKYDWEIIVVDDGSTDKTRVLLEKFAKNSHNITAVHNAHQGKAATVISGIFKARNDYVLFSDLDQATPIIELEKILPWFDRGFDIVFGSRNREREGAPVMRQFMARGFMLLRTILLGLPGITDTQFGFKCFRRTVAQEIFNRLKLYGSQHEVSGSMVTAGFDIELLYVASRIGCKIKEVPVEWHYVETRRVNPLKDSWQGLLDIISIKRNAWRGLYK
jgi:dolichyl-phosphate beta-glucosyltransferase